MRKLRVQDGCLVEYKSGVPLSCWCKTENCSTNCAAVFHTYHETRKMDLAYCAALPLYGGEDAVPLGVLVKDADEGNE